VYSPLSSSRWRHVSLRLVSNLILPLSHIQIYLPFSCHHVLRVATAAGAEGTTFASGMPASNNEELLSSPSGLSRRLFATVYEFFVVGCLKVCHQRRSFLLLLHSAEGLGGSRSNVQDIVAREGKTFWMCKNHIFFLIYLSISLSLLTLPSPFTSLTSPTLRPGLSTPQGLLGIGYAFYWTYTGVWLTRTLEDLPKQTGYLTGIFYLCYSKCKVPARG
jgi:hypothetical protein